MDLHGKSPNSHSIAIINALIYLKINYIPIIVLDKCLKCPDLSGFVSGNMLLLVVLVQRENTHFTQSMFINA